MKTERLFLMDIETGDRLRAVDRAKVAAIKASVAGIGLRTPITVSATRTGDEWHFRLVAGAHRLEALRQLGEEYAECFVMEGDADDAALWEIDENFARAELTEIQRADHHARRKAIMERKGLVRTRGGDRKSNSQPENLKSYAAQAAETLGVGQSSVHRDLHRASNILPEIKRQIEGTELDKGVVLDELAKTPCEEQPARLVEIREQRSQVRPAPDPLNDPEAHEKQLAALMSAWNRAAAVVREEFLLRIDRPVFDRGAA